MSDIKRTRHPTTYTPPQAVSEILNQTVQRAVDSATQRPKRRPPQLHHPRLTINGGGNDTMTKNKSSKTKSDISEDTIISHTNGSSSNDKDINDNPNNAANLNLKPPLQLNGAKNKNINNDNKDDNNSPNSINNNNNNNNDNTNTNTTESINDNNIINRPENPNDPNSNNLTDINVKSDTQSHIKQNQSQSQSQSQSRSQSQSTSQSTSQEQQQLQSTTTISSTTSTRKPKIIGSLPRKYEVLLQARVRSGDALDSTHITDLPEGSIVIVTEIKNRRAKICEPIHGWLSVTSKYGAKIIIPMDPEYAKIGARIVYRSRRSNTQEMFGKVVDYDENTKKYKVIFDDNPNTPFPIDLRAPQVTIISLPSDASSRKTHKLSVDAPHFDPNRLQTANLFNRTFENDYPGRNPGKIPYLHPDAPTVTTAKPRNNLRFSTYGYGTAHLAPSPQLQPTKLPYQQTPVQTQPIPTTQAQRIQQPHQHLHPHGHPSNTGAPGYPPQPYQQNQHQRHPQHGGPQGPNQYPPPHPYYQNQPHRHNINVGSIPPHGGPPHQQYPSRGQYPTQGHPNHSGQIPQQQGHQGHIGHSGHPSGQGQSQHSSHPSQIEGKISNQDNRGGIGSISGGVQRKSGLARTDKMNRRQTNTEGNNTIDRNSIEYKKTEEYHRKKILDIVKQLPPAYIDAVKRKLKERGITEETPEFNKYFERAKQKQARQIWYHKLLKQRQKEKQAALERMQYKSVSDIPNPYNLPSTLDELKKAAERYQQAKSMKHPLPQEYRDKYTEEQWHEYCKQHYQRKHKAVLQRMQAIGDIQIWRDHTGQEQYRATYGPTQSQQPNQANNAVNAPGNMQGVTRQLTARVPSQTHDRNGKGLMVLRGLPGSGKTTLANKLAKRSQNARICTEDKYHWSGNEDGVGDYKFQPSLVFQARDWCTKEIRDAITHGVHLVILDNHNARISMYEDHINYAVKHGYRFRIIEFVASEELIDRYRSRSYKKFPREVYSKLLNLWEKDPRAELINPTFSDGEMLPNTMTINKNNHEFKTDDNINDTNDNSPTNQDNHSPSNHDTNNNHNRQGNDNNIIESSNQQQTSDHNGSHSHSRIHHHPNDMNGTPQQLQQQQNDNDKIDQTSSLTDKRPTQRYPPTHATRGPLPHHRANLGRTYSDPTSATQSTTRPTHPPQPHYVNAPQQQQQHGHPSHPPFHQHGQLHPQQQQQQTLQQHQQMYRSSSYGDANGSHYDARYGQPPTRQQT